MAVFSVNRLRSLFRRQPAEAAGNNFTSSLLTDVEAGRSKAIPALLALAFDQDAQIAADAVEAVTHLTAAFVAADWYRLDASMRSYSAYVPPGYPRITPQALNLLERFGNDFSLLLGLASMDRNGYVREEAVRRLATLSEGELPFLLMRVNDWVPQVRQAAYAACSVRLTPVYAARYIDAMPFVVRLSAAERHDFTDFIQSVEDLLSRPECHSALMDALASSDSLVRRTSFRLAMKAGGEDVELLYRQAFLSHDPAIRLFAARALRNLPAGNLVQKMFSDRLRHDALAAIRCEYLYLCREKYPERAAWALRNALLDVHPSVRSAARYYLRQSEMIDFPQFYRAALVGPETRSIAAALAGLGETGQVTDAGIVVDYLRHRTPAVRRAAVVALGRLNEEAAIPQLLAALYDESARVSRAAREALEPHIRSVSDALLWEVLTGATRPHERRNTLRLMFALPKWRTGVLLVRSLVWFSEQGEDFMVSCVTDLTKRWIVRFNSSALRPNREQLSEMRTLLESEKLPLPVSVLAQLNGLVQSSERLVR